MNPFYLRTLEIKQYFGQEVVQKLINKLILLAGVVLILSFASTGFYNQTKIQNDKNKVSDMALIITLLDQLYTDSSLLIENRTYPISRCSSELNSFDYEYTLRRSVLGLSPAKNSHPYLKSTEFPSDDLGSYTSSFSSEGYECKNALPLLESNTSSYTDSARICQFDIQKKPNCYLYATSAIGESYKLSYFSQAKNSFVIYTKYRNEKIVGPKYYVAI